MMVTMMISMIMIFMEMKMKIVGTKNWQIKQTEIKNVRLNVSMVKKNIEDQDNKNMTKL